jgi:uncharacterized membrane protein YebE (DUF533 family)
MVGLVPLSQVTSHQSAEPSGTGPNAGHGEWHGTAFLMMRTMIRAAKADGQIDRGEMDRILSKLS